MKTIITIIALAICHTSFSQALTHKNLKERLSITIEANFPSRFNSTNELKDVFYGKCVRYPKHCEKIKFDRITDFRIIKASLGEVIEEINTMDDIPPSQYDIEATFNFEYSAENIEHHSCAIIQAVIKKVIDGYEIDYIKIIGTKSIHEYYESIDSKGFYILNRLAYDNE